MRKQNQKWFHKFHTEDLPFPAWKTMEDQHFICGHRKAPLHPLPFRSFAPKAPGKEFTQCDPDSASIAHPIRLAIQL